MESSHKVFAPQFAELMRLEAEQFLKDVMESVNQAPDGEWIQDSEEQVRELTARFRTRVFESALQARIDAAEAAFPPSGDNSGRSGHTKSRPKTEAE